jgi:tetratricopeptide (TPR) repeat protein/transglutaminase-like putative cysteine protease
MATALSLAAFVASTALAASHVAAGGPSALAQEPSEDLAPPRSPGSLRGSLIRLPLGSHVAAGGPSALAQEPSEDLAPPRSPRSLRGRGSLIRPPLRSPAHRARPRLAPGASDPTGARLGALADELARDRRSPRGIGLVAEIAALADEAPDLSRVVAALAQAAEDRAAHPEVRALARLELAELEKARGSPQRSAALLRRLGFVQAWRIAGPFDDEGKRGFDAVYPPEHGIDLAASMPGKVREVSWRELPAEAVVDGFVHLGAALRPSREVVGYALAVVEAPRDERVRLWFGGSGAAKVLVNGAVAVADPGYHPARLDQRAADVTLRKGANRILVKLCHQSGRFGFYLRLADARGDGRTYAAGDPAAGPAAPGPAPAPVETAVAALERRARAARGAAEAEARVDLALALQAKQSADAQEARAAAEARRAAAARPASVEARLLAARLEDTHARRRLHVEAALAAAPDDPRALLALAEDELESGRPHAAVRLLDRAAAAAPEWAAPQVLRVDALGRAGLEARAALAAEEVARRFPTVPGAVRAAARAARRLGRDREAAARLRTLLALRYDDGEARSSLSQVLAESGDVGGAAAVLAEGLRLDPSDVPERLALASLLAANGRTADAEAAFEAALRIAPEDADALERRGRARLLAGDEARARADLERALELRPQSPDLKEVVRSLEPAQERFERPYLLDAPALARAAPAPLQDDDALVLGELKVTRVLPSGQSATFNQAVVKVLTARGADAFRRQSISWTPERQEVKVERARVWKPDGTAVDTHDESDRSASEPWYRLYYDTRAKMLSFPSLSPGDVLEVAWRIEDVARENLLSDYFGDVTFLEDGTRKVRTDWVILVPEGRKLYASVPAGVERGERKLPGGVVEHRFSARDVPRIVPEPGMPGWSEVARYVHVSTYASWDELARFYWGLVKDQLRPTEDVRRTAERLAREALGQFPGGGTLGRSKKAGAGPRALPIPPLAPGQPRPAGPALATAEPASFTVPAGGWDADQKRAIVRAIYGFVVSQTRYVGLEFGIHGYKPYRVDDVLRRRFGDCKDKASLLHALLASVGIDSRVVLLRMKRLGRIPESPASLAVFNHAILYVPDLDLWLDGTASHSGSRDLPGEDRGASVLVLDGAGPPRFGTIPGGRPEDNRVESEFEVALGAGGDAAVTGRSRITGNQAPEYRRAYLSEHERRAQLEKAFNRTFPGLEVRSVKLSDLTRLEDDVVMSFSLEAPRYAQPDSGGLRFTPFGAGPGYVEAYAPLSSRRYDLVLGEPMENRFTYRFVLPPGWKAVEIPEDAAADGPDAAFEVRHRVEGGVLRVEGHVTFKTGRVPAGRYAAFRELAAALDRAFARRIRIAPAAAARAQESRP